MTNRLSTANLTARSAAFARSLAESVSPTRLLPFRQRRSGVMKANAGTLLLPLLAALGLAVGLFAFLVWPAYAQEGSAPAKPTGLYATASHDSVTLTWDDPQDDSITGYVILRRHREDTEKGQFSEVVADTGSAAATYTDGTVKANTPYAYRIKAINQHGVSKRSRWFHIDTPAVPEPVNSPATGAPAISGTVQVGEELTAGTSGIADEDGLENAAFGYQWLAGDSDIAGAAGPTYTLADSDEGKTVRVQVSFTDDAGNDETLTSEATAEVEGRPNSPATGAPAITGTVQVGETLGADTTSIADEDGLENAAFSYQWLAEGSDISGATARTYTISNSDEGKAIRVKVSFTDDAGNDEELTSAATGTAAAAGPSEPPAKPTGLSATATHGQVTLTWDDPGDGSITGYVVLRRIRVNDVGGEFSVLVPDTGSSAATYTDDTVAASTTYTYRIKAVNGAGTSERSRWFHIDIPAAPEPETDPADLAPSSLTAVLTDGQVVLAWDAPVEDAGPVTGFEILRVQGSDDPATLAADTGSAATTYTDATATTASASYAYRVKAIRDGERSQASNEARVLLKPARPSTLTAPVVAHNSVTLSWRDPQDDSITGYVILRRDKAVHEEGTFATVSKDTGSAATTYTDDTAEPNKQYVYRIKAINAAGLSEISSWVRAYTPEGPDPADLAPSSLAAELVDGQVALSWAAPAEDAASVTGYEVLRAEGEGEPAVLVADTGNADTTYTDAAPDDPGESYAYRVRAIRGEEKSADSNEARVQLPPAAPLYVLKAVSHDFVMLSWPDPQDNSITGYRILRADVVDEAQGEFVALNADTGNADTDYVDHTVQPERSYVYRVLAINPGGVGEPSRDVEVRTPADPYSQEPLVALPSISEGNNDLPVDTSTTGEVDVGGSVTGNIGTAGDGDWFKVELEADTRYQIDLEGKDTGRGTLGSPLIQLLYDADGNSVTGTRDANSGVGFNSRLIYTPSASDAYFVWVAPDYSQEPDTGTYTLSVIVLGANGASEADTDFPASTTTTGKVDVGGSVTGNIDSETDKDWFKVELEAGKTYQFDMEGKSTKFGIPTDPIRGTLTDTWLFLYDESGTLIIAYNDDRYEGDIRVSRNSRIIQAATAAGAHYLEARGSIKRMGTYTLSVRDITPADDPPGDPSDPPPVDPNRPQVTLHLSDGSVTENRPPVTVTATVWPASSVPFTVEVSATPASPDGDFGDFEGPATADDFTLSANRVLRFAALATASTGTVTIRFDDDDVPEPNEVVTVSGVVSGADIPDPDDVTLTIVNEDAEAFDVWVTKPATVDEDAGTATVTYTLRTRGYGPPIIGVPEVYYSKQRGETATRGNDYTPPPGDAVGSVLVDFDSVPVSAFSPSATRPVWEAERTFTIGIVDDTEEEGNETIVFRVWGGSDKAQSIKRTITILDDDTTPTVTIKADKRDTMEGVPAEFTLTRTGSRQESLLVRVMITEEENRDLLASYVQTEQFITISRGEATKTFPLDVRDNVRGSEDGDITAEIAQTNLSQYEIGNQFSATVTVEHDTHSHPEFNHHHSHHSGAQYTEFYPGHDHDSHVHGDTGNRHSSGLLYGVPPTELLDGVSPGQHIHHAQEDPGHKTFLGPNLRTHDHVFHAHECLSITGSCYLSKDFQSGKYGGVLPREVFHQHEDAEPGHGYDWPDLRANGNNPAEGHVYIGGVWRVSVGDTITVDTWRVSDPDGMSNAGLRYQWLADYGEIRGATRSSYTVTDAQVGKKIRVKVTFTDDAGNEEILRSRATLKVKAAETEADDE